jgi:GNAT superfamily N-acetyltransferase
MGEVASVRRIRPGEGTALRDIRLDALRDDPGSFGSTHEAEVGRPAEWWETWAAAASEGGDACVYLAERAGALVGLAGAYRRRDDPRTLHLVSMWVAPSARRAGVGLALTRAVMEWASSSDADLLTLWVVDGNGAARRLYERVGFEGTELRQPLPGRPHVIETLMRMSLEGPPGRLPGGYVELVPMSAAEFDAFAERWVSSRSAAFVSSLGVTLDEAARRAQTALATRLPRGEATAGNHLVTLRVGPDERPIGWMWFAVAGDECVLRDIVVFGPHRGVGLGSAAVDELEEWARRNRCAAVRVELGTGDEAASAFFARLGYEQAGDHMRRTL